jgi:kumamolisin
VLYDPRSSRRLFENQACFERDEEGGNLLVNIKGSSFLALGIFLLTAALIFGQGAPGQSPHAGQVLVPDSSLERPENIGHRAHTNHLLFKPEKGKPGGGGGPLGETPSSLRGVYNLPNSGGNGIIAIVDAYHYPTAQNDFDTFSSQFGLPLSTATVCNGTQPCFRVVYASGAQPATNCGWNQEEALDIEWAHAMAPSAQIVLVEAASNSFSDLFQAVDVATGIVTSGSDVSSGEVSMSWGGSEFSGETSFDSHFTSSKVVYFASSGDTGGVDIYPSVSPNVVSAGGTTINRNSKGSFVSETAWSGSGGGPSAYESRPPYQNNIVLIVGSQRGAPDFSFDANPSSGVSVYDSTFCQGLSGWLVFGGTSVAAPSLAGIVNLSSDFYAGSASELGIIYSNLGTGNFRDITSGTAGSFSAGPGWDFVTGVGSDQGTSGK